MSTQGTAATPSLGPGNAPRCGDLVSTGTQAGCDRDLARRASDDHDEEFEAILDELEAAGYVERYVDHKSEGAMRLTPRGEQVANQLAMVKEDDDAAMLAGLLGDELEGDDDGQA